MRPAPVVAWAAAGAVAAAVAWGALVGLTGLIFHLMPAAPPLAATAALRLRGIPLSPGTIAAAVGIGAAVSAVSVAALATVGAPLDAPPFSVAALLLGVVAAGAWSWSSRRDA